MWYRPATLSSGSLFPPDRLVPSAVAACAVGRAGCRGFRPTASAPSRACTPTGRCSGGHTVFSLGRHILTKCWLGYGSPAGDFGLPFAWSIWPFHIRNSSMMLTHDFVLLAPMPLPCLGRMGCVAGLRVGCLRIWYRLFSFLDWVLMFPCFASCLFTVGRGIYLCAARLRRFFLVRCSQALGFSCSFYP